MPITTLLRRVLNRSDTEPNPQQDTSGATPALPLLPEGTPTPTIAGIHNDNALAFVASRGNIDEQPLPQTDFSDTSSMDRKLPLDEEAGSMSVGEKDAVDDLTRLEDQITQTQTQHVPERNAGFMRSFSGVVCIIIGTGCLQIPYAFAKTGWFGIFILFLSATIGSYTGILTIRCLYFRSGHRLHSFPQIGYEAFGKYGMFITQFFNYLYSLGATCLYIIISGQFIYQLVSTLGVNLSQKVWMVIVAIVMWIPVALIKEMSEAAIMAIFGLLTSVVVIVIASVMAITNPYSKMNPTEPPVIHDNVIGLGVPVALSSIVFSFSGSVVYPHVEAAMKKPKQWPMVIMVAMGFCAFAYLLIGVAGYWAYGNQVVSPVLDSIPTGGAATASKILITLHVIIAAPIMLLSFYLEIENQWGINAERLGKKREFTIRLAYRSLVVGIICGISLAIPYFADFLSLISSISCVTMFAILPIICYLKLYGHKIAPWYEKIWMAIVLIIGLIASIWGIIDAVKALIKDSHATTS